MCTDKFLEGLRKSEALIVGIDVDHDEKMSRHWIFYQFQSAL